MQRGEGPRTGAANARRTSPTIDSSLPGRPARLDIPSGTVTLLFTDIEGSTRLWEAHPDLMSVALERHDQLIRTTIELHGGYVFHTAGDSFSAVFSTAAAAVGASVRAQQAIAAEVWPNRVPIRVRMGLHTGECQERDGDYYGSVVNRAARLHAIAHGGQLLSSAVTASLVRDRLPEGVTIRCLGEHRLKDLDDPETVYQFDVPGLRSDYPPLASLLDHRRRQRPIRHPTALVGRERELSELGAVLDTAVTGASEMVLIAGEPGIGKTRLAQELAALGERRGIFTVWASGHDGVASPAYWPWICVLRDLVPQLPATALSSAVGSYAADLAVLLPELRAILGPLESPPDVDPQSASYRIATAVLAVLIESSSRQPLLVVLDDIHWYDEASLTLLEHVSDHLTEAAIVLACSYRDHVALGPAPRDALASIARFPRLRRIVLRGLTDDDARDLVGPHLGADQRHLVETITDLGDGNPFFLGEMAKLVADEPSLTATDLRRHVPAGVGDVIRRRVRGLSDEAKTVLTVAAVLDPDCTYELMQRATRLDRDAVVAAMDEAIAADLLVEDAADPGVIRFAHALIRLTIYGELTSVRRRGLHVSIARIMEDDEIPGGRLAPTLAHHYIEAGDAERAGWWSERAVIAMLATRAYDDAASLVGVVMDRLGERISGAQQASLLILLAHAQWRRGRRDEGRRAALAAAQIVDNDADYERVACACIAVPWTPADTDSKLVRLLRLALANTDDQSLKARLFTRLAWEEWYSGDEADEAALTAESIARQLDDADLIANALTFTAWIPVLGHEFDTGPCEELRVLSERAGNVEGLCWAHILRVYNSLSVGNLSLLDDEIAFMNDLSLEHRSSRYAWFASLWSATRDLIAGRFEATGSSSHAAFDLGRSAHEAAAYTNHVSQLARLAGDMGRYKDLVALLEDAMLTAPRYAVPRLKAWLASTLCELGRLDDAARLFGDLSVHDGRRDTHSAVVSSLADCAVALGDVSRARELYEALLPLAGRLVVAGGYSATVSGPADRPLGSVACLLGKYIIPDKTVLIKDDKIEKIGSNLKLPSGY